MDGRESGDELLDGLLVQLGFVPGAGSVGFPHLLTGASADSFCLDLLQAKGVLLLPGSVFDVEGGYFRLGFGRENMPEALGRLGEYLRERQ